MTRLRYGNTDTFLIGGLLVDTGYAGTLKGFYKALKENGLSTGDVRYVLATHYHPDHAGLIGELQKQGVKLILVDVQKDSLHFQDRIFERDGLRFVPADETEAAVISCAGSREFLAGIGIEGEIVHTPSHSSDSITLILDDGDCFAGDLEPPEYIELYDDASALSADWELISSFSPKRVFFAHRPAKIF